ncbi:hypothetical protein BB561_001904 [Smittium simulii]|uniref:Uncharacterized protein n=1 Tax=Smittium simulii TaxID=133385 RepID=A0A2T9YSS6_9FUNG|nr:hypothetical protein BB561_001904 [Smittium simulii]
MFWRACTNLSSLQTSFKLYSLKHSQIQKNVLLVGSNFLFFARFYTLPTTIYTRQKHLDWDNFVNNTQKKLSELSPSYLLSIDKKIIYNEFLRSFYNQILSLTKDESFIDKHRKTGIELTQSVFLSNEPQLYKNINLWIIQKHMLCMTRFKYPIGLQYSYNWLYYLKFPLTPQMYKIWLRGIIRSQSYTYTHKIPIEASPFDQIPNRLVIFMSFTKYSKIHYFFQQLFGEINSVFIPRAIPDKNGICSALAIANHAVKLNYRRKVWAAVLRSLIAIALLMQLVKMGIIWGEVGENAFGEGFRIYATSIAVPFYAILSVLIITYLNKYKFNKKFKLSDFRSLSENPLHQDKNSVLPGFKNLQTGYNSLSLEQKSEFNSTDVLSFKLSSELRHSSKIGSSDFSFDKLADHATSDSQQEKYSQINLNIKKNQSTMSVKYHKLMDIRAPNDETYSDLKSDILRLWMVEISKNGNNSTVIDDFFTFLSSKKLPFFTNLTNKAEILFSNSYVHNCLIYGTFSEFLFFSKWVARYSNDLQFNTWVNLISNPEENFSINGATLNSTNHYILKSNLLFAMASQLSFNAKKTPDRGIITKMNKITDTIFDEKNQMFINAEFLSLILNYCNKFNDFEKSAQTIVKFSKDFKGLDPKNQSLLLNFSEYKSMSQRNYKADSSVEANPTQTSYLKPKKFVNISSKVMVFFEHLYSIILSKNPQGNLEAANMPSNYLPPNYNTKIKYNNSCNLVPAWISYLLEQPLFTWRDYLLLAEKLIHLNYEHIGYEGKNREKIKNYCHQNKYYSKQGVNEKYDKQVTDEIMKIQLFLVREALFIYTIIKPNGENQSSMVSTKRKKVVRTDLDIHPVSKYISDLINNENFEDMNRSLECYSVGELYKVVQQKNKFLPELIYNTKSQIDSIELTLGVIGGMISRATSLKDFNLGIELYIVSNCIYMIYNKFVLFNKSNAKNEKTKVLLPGISEIIQSCSNDRKNKNKEFIEIINKYDELEFKEKHKYTKHFTEKKGLDNVPVPNVFIGPAISMFLSASMRNTGRDGGRTRNIHNDLEMRIDGAQALKIGIKILETFNECNGFCPDYYTLDKISRSGHFNNIDVLPIITKYTKITERTNRESKILSALNSLYK